MGVGRAEEPWPVSLVRNLLCYGSLVLPFYLLMRHLRRSGAVDSAAAAVDGGRASVRERLVSLFFAERTRPLPSQGKEKKAGGDSAGGWGDAAGMGVCFVGLMTMYLTWGLMQEKMMTQPYARHDDPSQTDRFRDSQFLVFVNRISAFVLAGALLWLRPAPPLAAPLYKLSFSSLSNILSSWCQYEALKHIIFPVQVLGKSFKIVPVMLMSVAVSGATFARHEYLTSLAISAGCGLFLYSQGGGAEHKKLGQTLDVHGIILMVGYIAFDSFTSNWQAELKRKYDVGKLQLMCGVNLFSSALTLFALTLQGSFFPSLSFVATHQGMVWDVVLLALCGAVGQLFIFETITRYGAVVFTIMMTVRQAAAIFLSCLWYGHELRASGVVGVLVVTGAVLAKPYLARRAKSASPTALAKPPPRDDAVPLLKEEKN